MKRFVVCCVATLLVACLFISNRTAVLYGYSENLTLYLFSSSSNATIVNVDKDSCFLYSNVYGESFWSCDSSLTPQQIFEDFSAKLIETEEILEGISYYAFSPKIKYRTMVGDKVVNLHVFVSDNKITVGTPIIFGSF